jgi:hypothetical protein
MVDNPNLLNGFMAFKAFDTIIVRIRIQTMHIYTFSYHWPRPREL